MTGLFVKQPEEGPDPLDSSGTVLLTFEDPFPCEVPGLVRKWDGTGFQVRHHWFGFRPDQIVDFECVALQGRARVVSTDIRNGYAETYFWLLTDAD